MTRLSRRPLILGNWKMNTSLDEANVLAAETSAVADAHPSVEVGVLPPAVWLVSLHTARKESSSLKIGSQDVSQHDNGAYTGELSIAMLAPWCDFILVGHSERRHHFHESDLVVRAKLDAALSSACVPVLAVGETETERTGGLATSTVERQLSAALAGRTQDELSRVVIAYEPVWAIGTGTSASTSDAQEMASVIRRWLREQDNEVGDRVRILYGGSMKPGNARDILAEPDIDGGLIGGASLSSRDISRIVEAAVSG